MKRRTTALVIAVITMTLVIFSQSAFAYCDNNITVNITSARLCYSPIEYSVDFTYATTVSKTSPPHLLLYLYKFIINPITTNNNNIREEKEMAGLKETKEKWKETIMAQNGVLGIGVGKNSIIVYVERGAIISPPLPETLDGWPVKIALTEQFTAF